MVNSLCLCRLVQNTKSIAFLNFGQSLVFSTGLTVMMLLSALKVRHHPPSAPTPSHDPRRPHGLINHLWLAASAAQVMRGVMSVGEVVAINGLLLQLSVPFNFIGYTYQELRQVLRDKANAPVIGQAPVLTPC